MWSKGAEISRGPLPPRLDFSLNGFEIRECNAIASATLKLALSHLSMLQQLSFGKGLPVTARPMRATINEAFPSRLG